MCRHSPSAALWLVSALATLVTPARAFTPAAVSRSSLSTHTRPFTPKIVAAVDEDASPLDGVKTFARVFSKSLSDGRGFKQALTGGLAGEYDRAAADAKITQTIESAPVVMFSWTMSPACKKAKELFALAGISPLVVELNEPWSEGNPIRAELGERTGRTSVPSIWIGGKYVGGCDDGPSEEAPGIVKLAFMGKLQDMVAAAAASAGSASALESGE